MRVLAFDVFGTVVDWYGSIVREVSALRLPVDPGQFAIAWRAGYRPAMARVRSGELGWTSPGQLVDAFQKAMDHTTPGQISEPFRTRGVAGSGQRGSGRKGARNGERGEDDAHRSVSCAERSGAP